MDIFCKIINGDVPSYTIFEDELVKVIMDVSPRINGHCLIIPKVHYQDLYDIKEETLGHIMVIAKKIGKLLEEKLGCVGITLEENNGSCQEVKHFHLHVIPRYQEHIPMEVEEVFHKIVD